MALLYTLGDKEHTGQASCEAKWILDGRFLQQEYHSRFQGKLFHVVQLLGYDNPRKKTIEIMMDNLNYASRCGRCSLASALISSLRLISHVQMQPTR